MNLPEMAPQMADRTAGRRPVAIIGGGFTGAACAVHMVRVARAPLAVEIIEPREMVGGGVAYGSAAHEHRINVPSDRMTVFSEPPRHFSEWLDRHGIRAADREGWTEEGHFYSRRQAFGAYMAALVEDAAHTNPSGSTVRHVRGRAADVVRTPQGVTVTIEPSRDPRRYAAAVIAATHAAPSFKWPLLDNAGSLPQLCPDPWHATELAAIPRRARVLIVGTGLTMADVVVTLRKLGHEGEMVAVSRRGLLPRRQGEFDNSIDFLDGAALPDSALAVLRRARRAVAGAEAAGLTWRAGVDALRRALPKMWPNLPVAERRKALRHLRAFWDVHRYRMAPQVAELIDQGLAAGWLTVLAGKVGAIGRDGERFAVALAPRRSTPRTEPFDAVVNCTGPDSDIAGSGNPLFVSLLANGVAVSDPFRLGLAVDAEARAISAAGIADPLVRVAGPLARGQFGEIMGLPEVADHAKLVAGLLVGALEDMEGEKR